MKKNYAQNKYISNDFLFQGVCRPRKCLTLLLGLAFMLGVHAQKGQGGNNNKVFTLSACAEDIGNGLYRAYFGYTNPTNKTITIPEENSFVFLSTQIDDEEYKGIQKIPVLNTFEPGTVERAFSVVFNSGGHAKWTIVIDNSELKIRVTAASPICKEPDVIFPVFGGVGKSFTKLGSELTALVTDNAGEEPSDIIYQINEQKKVLIEIIPVETKMAAVLTLLTSPPYSIPISDFIVAPQTILAKGYATIDVYFPIGFQADKELLLSLKDIADINFIRPLYRPIPNAGVIKTLGDDAMRANIARASFVLRNEDGTPIPLDGAGIDVGVISDSFDKQPASAGQPSKATLDIQQGDLSPVEILKEYPYGVASDEGRAMLQLIHDVAPGAGLGFSTGILSPRDMALAIDNFAALDYNIVTDDITYPLEPFFDDPSTNDDDGQITKAIKDFTADGGIYVTSAGNVANYGYQSVFVNSTSTPVTNPALPTGTKAHVFGGNQDVFQEIVVDPGTYFLVLQWDQGQASQDNSVGAATDLDFYVLNNSGDILVNTNRVNLLGDGVEAAVFQSVAENAVANIMITSANGNAPANLAFRYILFRSDGLQVMEYNQGAPTVSGHAMTLEAITVGAVDYRLPLKGQTLIPEFFSSFGGPLANGISLQVDLAAPDGGNTTVLSIGNDINDPTEDDPNDPDTFTNFFGTSAAAPHVAGAAALLLSTAIPPSAPGAYSPSWYPDGLPGGGVAQLLKDNAIQMPGTEAQTGSGLINVLETFKDIAAQTAVLDGFVVVVPEGEDEPIPGVDTYDVTISGNYIPSDATVFLGDEQLEVVGEITDTQITATVTPFTGNPQLTVFTNSGDLPGGGASNGLNILPDGKIAFNIIANNTTIEYGDAYEDKFTYRVVGLPGFEDTVFGLPEGETLNGALTALGLQPLPEIVLAAETAVGPYPDVAFYVISAGFGGAALTPEQLAAYQVNFINTGEDAGKLTVIKKDLTIVPEDVTIVYGDAVEVVLNYSYNGENVLDNADFLQTISNSHDLDFFEDNTLILINKLRAVVNEQEILNLLNDGSWMASERIIQNKLRAVVNGEMNLIDLDVQNFDNYFDIEPIGNKLRAVVNKLRAVVNGQNLLNNEIDLLEPVTNKLRAVVNGTGILNENGFESFDSIFAVVDFEDGSAEDEEPRTIDKVFATNLLTGLDVTGNEGPSLIFPGAFLSPIANNFNRTYGSGNLVVTPATLTVTTTDLDNIDYGTTLTAHIFSTVITGFVYNETIADVFPSETMPETGEIPYYFVDADGNELELDAVAAPGSYQIKVRNPKNYDIEFQDPIGVLQIVKKSLKLTSEPLEIEYGTVLTAASFGTPVFEGFAPGEDETSVFPSGIAYYLVDALDTDVSFEITDNLPVGDYFIRIDEPLNYQIEYGENHGGVSVSKKTLTVNTTAKEMEYGTPLNGSDFSTNIVGFVTGEDVDTVFPDGIPYYLVADGSRIELEAVRDVGSYEVRIDETETVPQNYTLVYGDDHEGLSVTKKSLTVTTSSLEIVYGDYLAATSFSTIFDTFVLDDDEATVFPGGTPYYLEDGLGSRFEIDAPLEVGVYVIKIDETETSPQNYSLSYAESNGELTVVKKSLSLAFNDLVINQGSTIDFSQITFKTGPLGYEYSDDTASVFGTPLPLFFEDADGGLYAPGATGVYFIRITAPKNYSIAYTASGVVYVNPAGNNVRKVRTYLDCVEENPGDPDGLIYIANYRYENPNDETIFVLNGPENRITGSGQYGGMPPIAFLPGQGTFQIRFNGTIKWELITLDSNNKTASTSDASVTSNKCGSTDISYLLVPNTVETNLSIYQNVPENSTVEIFSFYGVLYFTGQFTINGPQSMDIDMSYYPTGFYVVRMTSKDSVKVYSIVKS